MSLLETMIFHASDHMEFVVAFCKITNQQMPEVRHKLHAIRSKYLDDFGLEGAFERFNDRSVEQVLSDFSADEINRLLQKRYLWNGTRTMALTGSADAVQKIGCPKCGAALSIRFDPASPQADGTTDGFLIINCLACDCGCCADKVKTIPPWVSTLGPNIQTMKPDGSVN